MQPSKKYVEQSMLSTQLVCRLGCKSIVWGSYRWSTPQTTLMHLVCVMTITFITIVGTFGLGLV